MKTKNNLFSSVDKTQKGGGIWSCTLLDKVVFKDIDEAVKYITDASQEKIIKLILSTHGKSLGFFDRYKSGFRCLDKYLEAYYAMLLNVSVPSDAKYLDFKKLGELSNGKKKRLLYGLAYLYLKKNLKLSEDIKNKINTGIYNAREEYKSATKQLDSTSKKTSTNTSTSTSTSTGVDKNQEKINAKNAYNTELVKIISLYLLEDKTTKSIPEIIIALNGKIRAIISEQLELEKQELASIKATAKTIRNAEAAKAQEQANVAQNSITGINSQQIIQMKQKIGDLLLKLSGDVIKISDDNVEKATINQKLKDYSGKLNTLNQIDISNFSDPNKIELSTLYRNVIALDSFIAGQNYTKGFFNKYKTIYNVPASNSSADLLSILNKMTPSQLSSDYDKLFDVLNELQKNNEITDIKIELRLAILVDLLNKNKVADNSVVVLNIIGTLSANDVITLNKMTPTGNTLTLIITALDINKIQKDDFKKLITQNFELLTKQIVEILGDKLNAMTNTSEAANFFIEIVKIINIKKTNFIISILDKITNTALVNGIIVALTAAPNVAATVVAVSDAVAIEIGKLVNKLDDATAAATAGKFVAAIAGAAAPQTFNNIIKQINKPALANGIIQALTAAPADVNAIITATVNPANEALSSLIFTIAENPAQKAFIKYAAMCAILRTEAISADAGGNAVNDANSVAAKLISFGLPQAIVDSYRQAVRGGIINALTSDQTKAMFNYYVIDIPAPGGGTANTGVGVPGGAFANDVVKLINRLKYNDRANTNILNNAIALFDALYGAGAAATSAEHDGGANNSNLPAANATPFTFPNWNSIKAFINAMNDTNADALIKYIAETNTATMQLGGKRSHRTKKHIPSAKKHSRKHNNSNSKNNKNKNKKRKSKTNRNKTRKH